MEPPPQLDPEAVRKLARRLFSEQQFKENPKACILKALDWLDQAAGDTAREQPPSPSAPKHPLVARLEAL